MGRQPKEDLSLFTNEKGEIQYHKICNQCPYPCKQAYKVEIQYCPRWTALKKDMRKKK